MGVLNDVDVNESDVGTSVETTVVDAIKETLAAELWNWFEAHKTEVIFSKRILRIYTVSITVGDIETLFVRLFGLKGQ